MTTEPIGNVVEPMVTGSTIIALKYNYGVIIACNDALSYGSTLKFKEVKRIEKITKNMAIAATGYFADFQAAVRKLEKLEKENNNYDDGIRYSVKEYTKYLSQLCYNARNKMNPYFNTFVVAGYENGEKFVGTVDHLGNYFQKDFALAGFGRYFCHHLLATEWNKDCTLEQAKRVIFKCFEVLFARGCQEVDTVCMTVVDARGVTHEDPRHVTLYFPQEMRNRANYRLWQ